MHSGYGIPEIHHRQQQQQESHAGDNNCAPVLLSMNQTHILEQIHTLPATQQLFLDQHHFFPPQSRLSHHYGGGAASSSAFLPVNFKLGLNEICTRNNSNYKDCSVSSMIEGEDALVRGSEQYEVPEARHYSSLGMLHCWQNQQDSSIKQQPFWEPLPSEVSNENSEIVDRQEHIEMSQKEALTNCLESKSRAHFGELEAIYKRLGTSESNQTTCPIEPVTNTHLPVGIDHGSEANSTGEEVRNATKKRKKKKKKKETTSYNQMISPMAEFIENLVKQVIDHQENLHKKFAEVIERLDVERREREENWRNQELAHFEQEAAERAHERHLAESREATIVSYLEKITGQKINLPSIKSNSSSKSDDFDHGDDGARKGVFKSKIRDILDTEK
ncbi:hypothetical protein BUALT_Bualt10G0133400 [Buddleja alternifolia]|uniref:Uncharacterized protein n=1 Tax=Buddleja alternifolia TaxID=168488 RepID=A0AAV6WZ46_9LAMI|nr:hypothetical protein BUALT_Bualt10G0133400 [Buddleja alternifolia]